MFTLALRNLWEHKLRTLLLGAAIVAGVSFVVASFVFTDSLSEGFSSIFSGASEGIDIVVGPPEGAGQSDPFNLPRLPGDLGLQIAAVPGVERVRPNLEGFVTIVEDGDGAGGGGFGPPTFAVSWPDDSPFFELAEGVAPSGPGEAVVDVGSAGRRELAVGDTIDLVGGGERETFTIVGLFTIGGSEQAVGPTFLGMEYETVAGLIDAEGQASGFDVAIASDADLAETVSAVTEAVGDTASVVDARAEAEREAAELEEGLGFFNTFLLVFAAISLVVGSFVVYNAFRVVVSQRSKELALLRLLGTTRRQLVTSVLGEAGAVGVVASLLGVGVGIVLARGVRRLLDALGTPFPDSGLILQPRTVLVGLIVGVITTLAAALIPSLRTASITPMEALRDQPNLRPRRAWWGWVGGALLIGSVAACLVAVSDASDGAAISGETGPIAVAGAGAFGCFVAVLLLSRTLVKPVVGAIGRTRRGTEATIGTENARRAPRRTATTASALTIGLGLVATVAVLAESVESTIIESVETAFAADLILQSSEFGGFGGMSPEVADVVSSVDEVESVSRINAINARLDGESELLVAGVEPATVDVAIQFEDVEGSFGDLAGDTVAVQRIEADRLDLSLGDSISLSVDGEMIEPRIVAIFDLAGEVSDGQSYYMPYERVAQLQQTPTDLNVNVALADGVSVSDGKSAVEAALADFPTVSVLDVDDVLGQVRGLLLGLVGTIVGLLAMSLLVAVVGIVLTLYLAVIERTRETGLLRAVGMTRRQVRRMIRWESVLISVFGTLLGLSLGLFLGWVLAVTVVGEGVRFSIPWVWVVGGLAASFVAGVLASIVPAYRASRLDVLTAIAYE